MFQLIYLSAAVKLMQDEELQNLLAQSRSNNERLGITGMLLYHEGNFIQVLEGEELQVKSLYYKIEQDNRHRGIIKLLGTHISQRDFADWSMGFKFISASEYNQALGYINPVKHTKLTASDAENDREAISLLKTFTKVNLTGR